MAEIVLTGEKYPVRIGGATTARRVQSFSVDRTRTAEEDYEMGTTGMIGVGVGPWTYTGRMSANVIDTSIERLFVAEATATTAVTVVTMMAAAGVAIEGKDDGIAGAVLQSVNYNISVPNGKVTAEYSFKGTGTNAGVLGITAPVAGGQSSFRSPKVFAKFGTMPGASTHLLRVKSIGINVQWNANENYQISATDPFFIEQVTPQVTATIEWHNIVLNPADPTNVVQYRPMPEPGAGDDLEVQIIPTGLISDWDDAGNLQFTAFNLVVDSNRKSQQVGQTGSRTISYRSEGDATTGGFSVQVLP